LAGALVELLHAQASSTPQVLNAIDNIEKEKRNHSERHNV
jgi:hypothetical protein